MAEKQSCSTAVNAHGFCECSVAPAKPACTKFKGFNFVEGYEHCQAYDWKKKTQKLPVPREDDAVGVDAVADEAGHRDAAVLDLGVAEPADGLGRRVLGHDAERVVEADLGAAKHPVAPHDLAGDAVADGRRGNRVP